MTKFLKIVFVFLLFLFFLKPGAAFAQNSFVSIINPIRGSDFWNSSTQKAGDAVQGQLAMLKKFNLPATWLLRFDALENKDILGAVNEREKDERGLFLEVTPSWAKKAGVTYHASESWHSAGSAFLTGYDVGDREKLIDAAFDKFKNIFNIYPKSVGAWWIDSHSLSYMQKKYRITSAMIVSDQYSTDNYQIWGQYFSTPYYPSNTDALHPAQFVDNKIPVVMVQWAERDPVNAYGNGVEESTFSVQPNDYIDYHNLDINYFGKLLDIYTKQKFNKFGYLVVGLENSYDWAKYKDEYGKQMELLSQRRLNDNLNLVTLSQFSDWYQKTFPGISPDQLIVSNDPLGSYKKTVWYMNPHYRVGLFVNIDGVSFRDIRQYTSGTEELCLKLRCDFVNFATSATRVLDDVSFGDKWVIDPGKVTDFSVARIGEGVLITYKNEVGTIRKISLLPRDIGVDGKISTIDGAILNITKSHLEGEIGTSFKVGLLKSSIAQLLLNLIKFIVFLIFGIMLPGYILVNKSLKKSPFFQKLFISTMIGFVTITLSFYLFGLLGFNFLIYLFPILGAIFLLKQGKSVLSEINFKIHSKFDLIIMLTIISGTLFQLFPVFQSGFTFEYGIGLWGPNTHDGIWHVSLINQLIKAIPPQNPIFGGQLLKNYHYLYDVLVATSAYILKIPVLDLLFRFYPLIFSSLLGIGTYYLARTLFSRRMNSKDLSITTFFALIFVYFAGSFGWIVELIKGRGFSGESNFWANQSISYNLNPPFAVSLLIIIAIFQLLPKIKGSKTLILLTSILCGSLIAYKAYGGILILGTLLLTSIVKKSFSYLVTFTLGVLISALLYIANFTIGQQILIFSPFWFINSMIDSSDRVGWVRLTLMREAGLTQHNWFKFLAAEGISFIIFTIGNLGTRFIGLFIFKSINYFAISIFSFLSFLIPIFVIQVGNPWNTIQFMYYFLYIESIFAAVVLTFIFTKLKRPLSFFIVIIILVITPINAWATANTYITLKPHSFISSKESEALDFLKMQTDGLVLTFPYDKKLKEKFLEPRPLYAYDSTAYVSALSAKSVFVEDEGQNQILLTNYTKRLVASKDFFSAQNERGNEFLKKNSIKYIYLLKVYGIRLDEGILKIKNIFDNDEVIIYKTR